MRTYLELAAIPSQFLSITGVPPAEFDRYLPPFTTAYHEQYPAAPACGPPGQPAASDHAHDGLLQMADKLFFIWMAQKRHTPPPVLALQFRLSTAQVSVWIERLVPVLEVTVRRLTTPILQPMCVTFLQLLDTVQVQYLIIGGHAVAFHGYRRPILDLDIFIATDPLNAHKMEQLLRGVGHDARLQAAAYFQWKEKVIRIGMPPFDAKPAISGDRFFQFGMPPIQLEVMTSISAVTFEECYPQRVAGVIAGVPVQFIGLEHLQVNKAASIRDKDADDLAHLTRNESIQ